MFRPHRSTKRRFVRQKAVACTGVSAGRPSCIPSFLRPETYRHNCAFVPPRNEAALPSRPLGVGGAEGTESQDAPRGCRAFFSKFESRNPKFEGNSRHEIRGDTRAGGPEFGRFTLFVCFGCLQRDFELRVFDL